MKYKITIITPTFNSERTIAHNIESVKNQDYKKYEHLIIDNKSSDKTLEIINKNIYENIKVYSDKDEGIYDAINKGINFSSGEIISVLHSDDFFFDNKVLSILNLLFNEHKEDIIYGNLIYVKKNDPNKTLRKWISNNFVSNTFERGWSPPHPSFFVKKKLFSIYGNYNQAIGNSADIELMYRLLEKNKIEAKYINKTFVKMRYGGKSNYSLNAIVKQNIEILKFLKINKNIIKILKFICFKLINRLMQFIKLT